MATQLKLRPCHDPHQCAHQCPAGDPCCCTNAHPHQYHICIDEKCFCHGHERYEGCARGEVITITRTRRVALSHLGMLDLRALLKNIRGR